MRKTLTTLLALTVFIFTGFAQQTQFQRNIGGSSTENSYAIEETSDGGFISVGYTQSFGQGKKDVYLVKTDGLGTIEWAKAYGGTGDDVGWNITIAHDSGYVIVGTTNSFNSSNDDALIFKTDKSGTVEWTRSISSDSFEDGYSVISSLFGSGFYVTGFVRNDSTGDDGFLAKLNSNGTVKWYKKFGSDGNEEAYGLAEDNRGNIVICGITTYDSITQGGLTGNSGNSDAFIAKFDSTGGFTWMKTLGSTEDDVLWDIKVDKNTYYLAGWTKAVSPGDDDILIVTTDTNGKVSNSIIYGSTGNDKAFEIVVKPGSNGDFAIVGYADPMGGDQEVIYAEFSSAGQLTGFNLIGSTGKDGHWPTGITKTRDGGFAILSTSNSFGSSSGDDLFLIKTNGDGETNCNTITEVLQASTVNLAGRSFGSITVGIFSTTPTLTTTTVTKSTETTLCCKLSAKLPKDAISLCEGSSVRIGTFEISGMKYKWTDGSGKSISTEANPLVNPTSTTTYKLVVSSNDSKCTKDSATVKVTVNTLLKEDFARDTSFCIGDSARISGSANIVFHTWRGSHLNSQNRFITVKLQDTIYFQGNDINSCTYKDTMIVTTHSLPTFSLGKDTTICEDDGITLTGPSSMTSYDWNKGESSKQSIKTFISKAFTLDVVDSNGCKFSDNIQILTNPSSPFSIGADDTFCDGGKFTILGPGALSNYFWNDTASSLQNLVVRSAGTYHLKAHNSFGCPSTDTIVLVTRNKPAFSLGPDVGLCLGGSKWLVGPDNMTTYRWNVGPPNDSLRVNSSGTYMLTVTDKYTCAYTDTIVVNDVANPTIALNNDTTICIGDSLLLTPGAGFVTYAWNTGSPDESIYAKLPGFYEVTVEDNNGCSGSASMNLDTMTCHNDGIENLGLTSLSFYPVPASDQLYINFEAASPDEMEIRVIDLVGKVMFTETHQTYVGVNELEVDLNALATGTYFVWLNNSNGSAALKILVE